MSTRATEHARIFVDDDHNVPVLTTAWLIWRPGKDGPEFGFLVHSQAAADENIAYMKHRGWRAVPVALAGWGAIALENAPVGPISDEELLELCKP